MQTKIFFYAALLSAVSFVTAADSSSSSSSSSSSASSSAPSSAASSAASSAPSSSTTRPPSPQSTSQAVSNLNVFYSNLRTQSAYKSFSGLLDAAVPTGVSDLVNGPPTITALPEFSGLPKEAKDYFSSVNAAQQSILNKDLRGAAPKATGMIMAAGAAAAGVLGVAAMI